MRPVVPVQDMTHTFVSIPVFPCLNFLMTETIGRNFIVQYFVYFRGHFGCLLKKHKHNLEYKIIWSLRYLYESYCFKDVNEGYKTGEHGLWQLFIQQIIRETGILFLRSHWLSIVTSFRSFHEEFGIFNTGKYWAV